jgi:peptidoglycan/xylan/chitin deacetylase (PgdA/CDA1 family)
MRRLIILLNLLAPFIGVALLCTGHSLLGVTALLIAHAPLLYSTLMPNCPWLGPVVRDFTAAGNEIWLTIDDGPDPIDTPRFLDLLDRHQARATFFLIGDKATRHPELVREIAARGHTIGNHTQTHPAHRFWCLGPRRLRDEITRGQQTLAALTTRPTHFRAPAGMRNPFVHPILRNESLTLVGWTARGYDGTDTDEKKVLARLLKNLRPGAILLLHESTPIASGLLECLLTELTKRDYRCVLPRRG